MSKTILALALFLLTATIAVNAKDTHTESQALLLDRAHSCERDGRLEEANAIYTQVLSTEGKNCALLARRGANHFALGQYKKALADANACVAFCPGQDAYLRRSLVLTKLGRFESALADVNRCFTPGVAERTQYVFFRRCIDSMLCGNSDDARKDAETVLTMLPRSVLSFEVGSTSDALCNRDKEAICNLAQLCNVKLHSTSQDYKVQENTQYNQWPLSKMHSPSELQSPQYQAQFKFWQESNWRQGVMTNSERGQLIARLEKDPHFGLSPAQHSFALAIIYFHQRDYDKAIALAARCAAVDMQVSSDLLSCYCHIMKKEFPAALSILNRLTLHFPDSLSVLDAVDLYHYAADTRQASITQMTALLSKNPKNAAALTELAKIYHDLSELDQSLKYCGLSLQLNPKDTKLLLLKATILTSQQKYADALQCLSRLMAEDKKNGPAYLARAAIYTQQGRWSDAVGDLSTAISLKYDLAKSHKARAACYAALKKFDLARQDLSLVHLINREYEAVGKDH